MFRDCLSVVLFATLLRLILGGFWFCILLWVYCGFDFGLHRVLVWIVRFGYGLAVSVGLMVLLICLFVFWLIALCIVLVLMVLLLWLRVWLVYRCLYWLCSFGYDFLLVIVVIVWVNLRVNSVVTYRLLLCLLKYLF